MLHSVVIIIVVVVKTFHFSVFRPTLLNAVSGGGEFAVLVGDRRCTAACVHCIFPPTVSSVSVPVVAG